MGSSAISAIIKGNTGPAGLKGTVGPTGPTGSGIGLTGNTGSTAVYITNIINNFDSTIFVPSDFSLPSTNTIITGTRGPTGYTGTVYGENLGTGLSLYSNLIGFTLDVKGLSFVGNLTASLINGEIVVTPLDVTYGITLSVSATGNRVMYSKTSSEMDTTRIQLGVTHNEFSFSDPNGITENSLSVFSEISGNIVEVQSELNDFVLGLTLGSIYYIHTPLGLTGFTLDPNLYGNNELLSFTLFVEGNGFTQFPSNVYFEDSPYSSVFGCGTNVMNLMTYDKGQNWFATIMDRGYGVNNCPNHDSIGSCCYKNADGERECVEYVNENWCSNKSESQFNSLTACDPLCRETAICCSNGTCIEGVSKEECEYFLGKYYKGVTCLGNPCVYSGPEISCCVGSTCISNTTPILCLNYYKGTIVSGNCCDINCDTLSGITGACCIKDPPPNSLQCSIRTVAECRGLSGIFYGEGSVCAPAIDVQNPAICCFDDNPLGYCCLSGVCQPNLRRSDCLAAGGDFFLSSNCNGTCTPSSVQYCCRSSTGCLPSDPGACTISYETATECLSNCSNLVGQCCYNGSCISVNEPTCDSLGGRFSFSASNCREFCGSCCGGGVDGCDGTLFQSDCDALSGIWRQNTSCDIPCDQVFCCNNGCNPSTFNNCAGTQYVSAQECLNACPQSGGPLVDCCIGGVCSKVPMIDCYLLNGKRFSNQTECQNSCGSCCLGVFCYSWSGFDADTCASYNGTWRANENCQNGCIAT